MYLRILSGKVLSLFSFLMRMIDFLYFSLSCHPSEFSTSSMDFCLVTALDTSILIFNVYYDVLHFIIRHFLFKVLSLFSSLPGLKRSFYKILIQQ